MELSTRDRVAIAIYNEIIEEEELRVVEFSRYKLQGRIYC